MHFELSRVDSPLGPVALAVGPHGLCAVELDATQQALMEKLSQSHPDATFSPGVRAARVAQRLNAYFEGEVTALDELAVAPEGTAFQQRVWRALRDIPAGRTVSYAQLAQAIGQPKATRAVGAANAKNPLAVVVPCHRVVAADGSLGGYSGGVEKKAWLLRHEGAPTGQVRSR
ncbi:MAG: methylated-DNA--[protein]-cysteine S-methyltransferase [Myxococcota bacterium]